MQPLNIDQTEISKFESTSSSWWNPEGEFKPLHAINPLRLEFIRTHTQLQDKTALDVGCGGGILAESMAQQGAHVTGIDMSQSALSEAKQHAKTQNLKIHYEKITVEQMAKKQPGEFHVVTCMELLEHVPDPSSVIQACAALAKPESYIFFSTLNRNPKSYLQAIIGAEYLLRLLPKGTHDYSKFIRPSELDDWARAANLQLIALTGIQYNPLSRQYKLCDSVDVNYLACYHK